MKTKITQNMKAIILGLVIALGAGYVSAWTGPSSAPTGGNVPAPINVGVQSVNSLQEKYDSLLIDGNFGLFGNFVYTPGGVKPTAGQILVANGTDGTVKWGTASASTTVTSGSTSAGTWFQIGNMLIEGGRNYPGTSRWTTVVFPKAFASLVSLNITMLQSGTGGSEVHPEEYVHATNLTTTGFSANTVDNDGYGWIAIGTAQ